MAESGSNTSRCGCNFFIHPRCGVRTLYQRWLFRKVGSAGPGEVYGSMFSKARLDTLSDGIYAGDTLLIALVGQRLFFITPHMEQGDHLRHRKLSGNLLIVTSLLAIAISFVNPRVALWCLALNFAAPLLRKWSHRPVAPD
jgi:hypothetical protein